MASASIWPPKYRINASRLAYPKTLGNPLDSTTPECALNIGRHDTPNPCVNKRSHYSRKFGEFQDTRIFCRWVICINRDNRGTRTVNINGGRFVYSSLRHYDIN